MREIGTFETSVEFSVCTLVTDKVEYESMRESFGAAGFSAVEYLYADNSNGNRYDAFEAGNRFLNEASGKYIIICHQDIELRFDTVEKLRRCIVELDEKDANWAVAGNAGYTNMASMALCISDPYGAHRQKGNLPQKVHTLDENFLLIKRRANLSFSHDLKGFHLYATDLCQVASLLGYSAYVIDFHLYHKSAGTVDYRFMEAAEAFRNKYTHALQARFLRTPVAKLFLSGSGVINSLCNTKFCFRLVKLWQKI